MERDLKAEVARWEAMNEELIRLGYRSPEFSTKKEPVPDPPNV